MTEATELRAKSLFSMGLGAVLAGLLCVTLLSGPVSGKPQDAYGIDAAATATFPG